MRLILFFFLVCFFSEAYTQKYTPIDSESTVSFNIKNFGSMVDGSFKGLKGTVNFDAFDLYNAKFDVTINTTTIDTGIGMRDNHLRKSDYFNAATYSTIRFISTKVVPSAKPNEGVVTGMLTIKKTSKEISFPFTYKINNGAPQFIGEFQIDRRDYDVGGNNMMLADELKVMLNVKASK